MQTVAALMILNNKLGIKFNPPENVHQEAKKKEELKTALNSFHVRTEKLPAFLLQFSRKSRSP